MSDFTDSMGWSGPEAMRDWYDGRDGGSPGWEDSTGYSRPYIDKATRKARCLAHLYFDELWKSGKMSRSAAYKQLATQLGMPIEKCHMLYLSKVECEKVISLYKPKAEDVFKAYASL